MKFVTTTLFSLIFMSIFGQDTIQMMQYNLLNYGNYYGDCTTSTNNVNTKNGHLRTIINHVNPDVFTVNELSDNTTFHQMILDQVLNTNGETKYRKAVSFNYAGSYIVNMLYYNRNKLALYKQDVVFSAIRDIDVFTLYYKAADLEETHDTIFFTCFVAHLKAGSSDSDASKRAGMVATAMSYIRTHDLPENMMFMGDLNLYNSEEQAYTNLTYTYNGVRYFYDPIDREGYWNNNASFSDVHTQSTHSGYTDCFSSGGLDDRFDLIMASEALLNGSDRMLMLTDTYRALGNDGQHYNSNITDPPTNTSAPGQVIDALFGMSDHLPVLVQLKVDASLGINNRESSVNSIRFANPNDGMINFSLGLDENQNIQLEIFDLYGKSQYQKNYLSSEYIISEQINLRHLPSGYYLFVVTDESGYRNNRKFFIKK